MYNIYMKLVVFFIICIVYLFLTIIHKDDNKFKSVKKKVRFDLDKNDIIIIPSNYKSDYDKNNYGEIKTKKIENDYEYPNFQKEYVRKLDKNRQNSYDIKNIFKNQKPYWDSLEIDLNRSYDNYQVNNFNNIRNDNIKGKEISDVFNGLTYSTEINQSHLFHHDSDVINDVLY